MFKRKYNGPYEIIISSKNIEYSITTELYCMENDFKVKFCMPEFSSSNIILSQFNVDNNKVELVIGYDMIIGRDLMVHIGLMNNFKRQVLQWYGTELSLKYPISILGQTELTSLEMREVITQAAELFSAIKAI